MNWQVIFQTAVVMSGTGAATAFVTAIMGRRKVKVDATALLSDASLRQLTEMREDLNEQKKEVGEQRAEVRRFREALYEHQRWDVRVSRRLAELGVTDIGDPPTLWP